MSIANELARARRRGIDLCPKPKEGPLLRHWRTAFGPSQFYGLFTPVGLLFRLIGRDALHLRPAVLEPVREGLSAVGGQRRDVRGAGFSRRNAIVG